MKVFHQLKHAPLSQLGSFCRNACGADEDDRVPSLIEARHEGRSPRPAALNELHRRLEFFIVQVEAGEVPVIDPDRVGAGLQRAGDGRFHLASADLALSERMPGIERRLADRVSREIDPGNPLHIKVNVNFQSISHRFRPSRLRFGSVVGGGFLQ